MRRKRSVGRPRQYGDAITISICPLDKRWLLRYARARSISVSAVLAELVETERLRVRGAVEIVILDREAVRRGR